MKGPTDDTSMTHVHLFAEGDTSIEASGMQACGWNVTAAARSRERPTEQAVAVAMATRRGQCRLTAVVALCRLAAQLQCDCQRHSWCARHSPGASQSPSCCWMRRPGRPMVLYTAVCPGFALARANPGCKGYGRCYTVLALFFISTSHTEAA